MLAVQPRAGDECDEELRAVGVRPSIGHREQVRLIMIELEVFIRERPAVNRFATGAIEIGEVSALGHESGDDTMKH